MQWINSWERGKERQAFIRYTSISADELPTCTGDRIRYKEAIHPRASATEQNILERFGDSEHGGQGWKPLLNVCHIRQHCENIRHVTMILEYLGQRGFFFTQQSAATSRNVAWICITQGGNHTGTTDTLLRSLDTYSSQMDRKTVDMCSVVREGHVSAGFQRKKKESLWVLCTKDEKDHPGC